jgi:hypothetical protein
MNSISGEKYITHLGPLVRKVDSGNLISPENVKEFQHRLAAKKKDCETGLANKEAITSCVNQSGAGYYLLIL